MLGVMFNVLAMPHAHSKRNRSNHTIEADDKACAKKRERMEMEQERRASIVDEEMHQIRVQEIVIGASSFVLEGGARSTTKDVEIEVDGPTNGTIPIDMGTIDSIPIADPTDFKKEDPPTY